MIQTRSSTNGIQYHETVEDAHKAADSDSTIWKISYDDGNRRVRLVKSDDGQWEDIPLMVEVDRMLADQGYSYDPGRERPSSGGGVQ